MPRQLTEYTSVVIMQCRVPVMEKKQKKSDPSELISQLRPLANISSYILRSGNANSSSYGRAYDTQGQLLFSGTSVILGTTARLTLGRTSYSDAAGSQFMKTEFSDLGTKVVSNDGSLLGIVDPPTGATLYAKSELGLGSVRTKAGEGSCCTCPCCILCYSCCGSVTKLDIVHKGQRVGQMAKEGGEVLVTIQEGLDVRLKALVVVISFASCGILLN